MGKIKRNGIEEVRRNRGRRRNEEGRGNYMGCGLVVPGSQVADL